MPAPTGPDLTRLRIVQDQFWTPERLLHDAELPAGRVLPLREALNRAPVGSLIVACEYAQAMWGPCSHLTRKFTATTVTEEPGLFGRGAALLPLDSLLRRDLILVLDAGVRERHLPALRAAVERLRDAPYLLNGTLDAFDCSTYQNALQRAVGLPPAVPLDAAWGAHLPIGALGEPLNTLLFAGVSERVAQQLTRTAATPSN